MQTKLTLRLDEDLVRRAKRFSRRTGKSVSKLVAEYFETLEVQAAQSEEEITPKVSALRGILKGKDVTLEDYERHLEEKYL